ncbi:hypothetical protein [Rosenbergiella collisarenosi]|uniref:hypothetical protein n=1 Tax=Rosenbergiella collisarenosi TaxID=1544695 RepID=UPI001F4F0B4D|nr:hypothetical protein [Rosenbergiella collisarenosi]
MEQNTQAPLDTLLSTIKPGETPFTDDYLSNAADSALKQIDMVIHRCKGDDLNVRAMQNCRNGIAQLVEEMNHRLDHETSEYNNVMDVIEQLHEQLHIATQSIKSLESSHEGISATATAGITTLQDELTDLRLQVDKAEREKEQLIADFDLERIEVSATGTQVALQLRRVQNESAEYRKEFPATLKADNEKLQQEVGKLRAGRRDDAKERQELTITLRKVNADLQATKRKLASGNETIVELQEKLSESTHRERELHALMLRDSGQDGETVHTTLSSAGHNISCRINTYLYQNAIALHGAYTDRDVNYKLNMHWQVRTASMIDMTVLASPWGAAILFLLPHLAENWNKEITTDLEGRIEAAMEQECPQLFKRLMNGQDALVSELNLSKRAENMLMANGKQSVRDVGAIATPDYAELEGCGEALTKEITNALITWENNWEKTHGAVEEYRRSKLFNVQSHAIYNREQRRKLKAMSKT